MITARISHGLGNQLYQYAAARSLADRAEDDLVLDLSFYRDPRRGKAFRENPLLSRLFPSKGASRNYDLDLFRVRAAPAKFLDLARHGFLGLPKFHRALRRLHCLPGNLLSEPSGDGFDRYRPGGFNYMEGFWQSLRYFAWNRSRLLKDLTLKRAPQGRNKALLTKIRSRPSVCLHVRLGDLVDPNRPASSRFGAQDPSYYREAIRRTRRKHPSASWFLFSDQPEKALPLLGPGGKVRVVDHNGAAPQEDLRLMSACRHFIIANSTFSWWAAWLAEHPSKTVIAPARWIPAREKDPRPDRIPPEWTRL